MMEERGMWNMWPPTTDMDDTDSLLSMSLSMFEEDLFFGLPNDSLNGLFDDDDDILDDEEVEDMLEKMLAGNDEIDDDAGSSSSDDDDADAGVTEDLSALLDGLDDCQGVGRFHVDAFFGQAGNNTTMCCGHGKGSSHTNRKRKRSSLINSDSLNKKSKKDFQKATKSGQAKRSHLLQTIVDGVESPTNWSSSGCSCVHKNPGSTKKSNNKACKNKILSLKNGNRTRHPSSTPSLASSTNSTAPSSPASTPCKNNSSISGGRSILSPSNGNNLRSLILRENKGKDRVKLAKMLLKGKGRKRKSNRGMGTSLLAKPSSLQIDRTRNSSCPSAATAKEVVRRSPPSTVTIRSSSNVVESIVGTSSYQTIIDTPPLSVYCPSEGVDWTLMPVIEEEEVVTSCSNSRCSSPGSLLSPTGSCYSSCPSPSLTDCNNNNSLQMKSYSRLKTVEEEMPSLPSSPSTMTVGCSRSPFGSSYFYQIDHDYCPRVSRV